MALLCIVFLESAAGAFMPRITPTLKCCSCKHVVDPGLLYYHTYPTQLLRVVMRGSRQESRHGEGVWGRGQPSLFIATKSVQEMNMDGPRHKGKGTQSLMRSLKEVSGQCLLPHAQGPCHMLPLSTLWLVTHIHTHTLTVIHTQVMCTNGQKYTTNDTKTHNTCTCKIVFTCTIHLESLADKQQEWI